MLKGIVMVDERHSSFRRGHSELEPIRVRVQKEADVFVVSCFIVPDRMLQYLTSSLLCKHWIVVPIKLVIIIICVKHRTILTINVFQLARRCVRGLRDQDCTASRIL